MMAAGHGYVRLNSISGLERVTCEDGRNCDKLYLYFFCIAPEAGDAKVEITSRDFDLVKIEAARRTYEFLNFTAIKVVDYVFSQE